MIHVIQYHHGPNWLPAAVTAHSIRKNGGLSAPRLTLYTTDSDVLENPYLPSVFDEIREPPEGCDRVWNTDWNQWQLHKSHVGQRAYPIQFRRFCMTKYFCFLAAPCEPGETLLYIDSDMLCLRSIAELENLIGQPNGQVSAGRPTWAARVNYWKSNGEIGHINAGLFAKNSAFEEVAGHFLKPVLDPEVFAEALELSLLDDEAALKWTLSKYGRCGLRPLDEGWNLFVGQYMQYPPLSLPRFAHWCCPQKPWFGEYPSSTRALYLAWESAARETCELMGYPPDGHDVPARFRWPFQIGEHPRPRSWRFHA